MTSSCDLSLRNVKCDNVDFNDSIRSQYCTCHDCLAVFVVCATSWWRHQMGTFSALLALCAGNSPVPGEFPAQRPVTRSFDVFFNLRPNKRLSKQSWGWWFEMPSHPSWRHCNVLTRRETFKWWDLGRLIRGLTTSQKRPRSHSLAWAMGFLVWVH